MANVGTAYVTIAPTMKGFSSKVTSALSGQVGSIGSSAGSLFSSSFGSSGSSKIGVAMGAVMGVASSVATSAFSAIGNSMGQAISRVDQLNNFPKVMQNLGYSSEDASRSIQTMSNAIDGLPTSLDTLSGMTQQLAPLCSNLDEATNISIALNNAMLAGGKSSEDVSRAMTQYTQALSKGKPDLMDWRTLQEVMPGQLNQIAQAMLGAGKNSNDLYEELKNGTLSMTDFNNAVLKLNSEGLDGFASFEQQARDATQGIGTALSNVRNRLAKAGETLINAFGATRISGAINAVTSSFGVIANKIAPIFTTAGNACEAFVTGIQSSLSDGEGYLQAFTNGISNFFATTFNFDTNLSFFDNLKNTIDNLKNSFMGLSAPVKLAITTISSIAMVNVGSNLVSSILRIKNSFLGVASQGASVVKFFQGFSSCVTQAGGGIKGIATVLNFLISPMGVVVAGIVALVAIFATLMATNEDFRNTVLASFSQVASVVQPVITLIIATLQELATAVLPVIMQVVQSLAPVIATVITAVAPILTTIISLIAQLIATLLPVLMPAITQILGIVQAVLPTVLSLFLSVFNGIMEVVNAVMPLIQAIIQTAMSIIQSVIQIILGLINGDWGQVWEGIKSLASSIWEGIQNIISTAINAVMGIIDSVLNTIKGVWDAMWNGISSGISAVWEGIKSGVNSGIEAVYNMIIGIKDTICGFFSDAWSWLVDSGKAIIDGLVNGIQSAIGGAVDAVSGAVGAIRDLFPFSPAKKGPFSGKGWVLYSGMSIMNALADGVSKRANSAVNTISGVMQEVASVASFDAGYNLAYATSANATLTRANALSSASSSYEKASVIDWLNKNLGDIINQNAPQTVIDNDAGALIVDNRLTELQRKAGMNRGN
jgi:tape measure domain-containing protein